VGADDAVAAHAAHAVAEGVAVVVGRETPVGLHLVAVVALLAGVEDAVTAALAGAAVRVAAVTRRGVAVVADFTDLEILEAVAADFGRLTWLGTCHHPAHAVAYFDDFTTTTVPVDEVAVVADFADVGDAVAATFDGARGGAAVAARSVAVVAGFVDVL